MGLCGYLLGLGEGPLPLHTGERIVLGRSRKVDIHIADSLLSRKHAELEVDGHGGVSLTDLDSTNRTFLNGKPLAPHVPVALSELDIFRLGEHVVTYVKRTDVIQREVQEQDSTLGTFKLDPEFARVIAQISPFPTHSERHRTLSPDADNPDKTGEVAVVEGPFPDQAMLTAAPKPRTISIDEWLAIPNLERVEIIIAQGVRFFFRGRELPFYEALASIRKGRPK